MTADLLAAVLLVVFAVLTVAVARLVVDHTRHPVRRVQVRLHAPTTRRK